MATLSRMDRLIKALGGEENLPPQLPQPVVVTPPSEDNPKQDGSTEAAKQEASQGEDWWNATPRIAQPPPPSVQHPRMSTSTPIPGDGKVAPLGLNFCPLIPITKFPYKFVKREFMQEIASAFFDEGKIWSREWEV